MKRLAALLVALLLTSAGIGAYFKLVDVPKPPEVVQLVVTRGDIVQTAIATGTLQATRTVDVGTQVSGKVQKLYVDYDAIVHKSELIAQLDPSLLQAQVDSAQATLDRAKITLDEDRQKEAVDDLNLGRAKELYAEDLATEQDEQQAQLTADEDKAQIEQDQAAVTVADASLQQAQVNLDHCVIRSPIDGVVLSRNVDEGQAVQASANVPSLFVLTSDLTNLQLIGSIDEADIGFVRPGQDATFTVDAYPRLAFHGTVTSVRLNPTTVSNVVTYQAVIAVRNGDLRLMPGMTANLRVAVEHASNVMRVPSAALRFRPTNDMFEAYHQPPPPTVRLGVVPAGSVQARQRSLVSGGSRRASGSQTQMAPATSAAGPTIDAHFTPVPRPVARGEVWVIDAQQHLRRVPVTTGISDGNWTELVSGDLHVGDELVTSIVLPETAAQTAGRGNPLLPQRRGGFGGFGGFGGPRFGR